MGDWEEVAIDDEADDEEGDEVDVDRDDDAVDEARRDEREEGVDNGVERLFAVEEGASAGDPFFRFVPLGFCLFDLKPSFICLGKVLVMPTTAFLISSGFAWR